jgi:hypothetical protein
MMGNRFVCWCWPREGQWTAICTAPWHVTQKLESYSTERLYLIPGWCLRSRGVYVTRKEEKAANYMPADGVIIKMRVRLGRHLVITRQGHPLQYTWMDCGCGSAFAPAGVLWEDEREENCIANPSRIEILGLAHGYKAPCRCGLTLVVV